MKTKIISALLDNADAPMLLINDQVHEWSNARFRDLPEALRTPILTWAQNQDSEWLELEGYRFQRLSAKKHTAILGYIVDRNRLQRTLLLKLLPALRAGGDPHQNTARVIGPLLGWKNCLVAKRRTNKSLEVLGHWQDGKLLPPTSQKLIGSAAQGLYEGEVRQVSIKALCREFPLDESLSETPSALWIGHRIDLPEQNGVGHLCVWGQPEHVDTEATEWLMGMAVDTLSAWLLSQHHAENKDYEPSSEPQDQLTGLPGPKTFDLALTHAANTFQQTQQDFLVALVDIDGLTHINDRYGMPAGDKLIQRFADELLNMCRRRDQVFRLGGDEFLLLMPMTHTPPPVAKRLDRISKQLQAETPEFSLNLSMSTLSEVKGSSEELMLTIDQRLKANKENNKK